MGFASKLAWAPLVLVFLLFSLPALAQTDINIFKGNVSIGGSGSTVNGAVVEAFSGSTLASSYTIGSLNIQPHNYSLSFQCTSGTAITLKVWGISGPGQTCNNLLINTTNISVSLIADGSACSWANGCAGGFCCSGASSINSSSGSGTCASSACTAATSPGGSSSSGGGGGGGGASTTTPAPAPSADTKEAVKEALPEAFKAADAAGNVAITTVSAPEPQVVSASSADVSNTLESVQNLVQTTTAKEALAAIQEAVSSGSASTINVKKTIEVVKATNKVTGESVTVSVVKLSVVAPANKELKNVEVIEVIPKAAAINVGLVTFKGEQPAVLEADPVVKWFFSSVAQGQKKDLSYTINKDIRSVGTTTMGVSGRPASEVTTPPPPPPELKEEAPSGPGEVKKPGFGTSSLIMVIVAIIVVAGWIFIKARKKPMK